MLKKVEGRERETEKKERTATKAITSAVITLFLDDIPHYRYCYRAHDDADGGKTQNKNGKELNALSVLMHASNSTTLVLSLEKKEWVSSNAAIDHILPRATLIFSRTTARGCCENRLLKFRIVVECANRKRYTKRRKKSMFARIASQPLRKSTAIVIIVVVSHHEFCLVAYRLRSSCPGF